MSCPIACKGKKLHNLNIGIIGNNCNSIFKSNTYN